MDQPAWLRHAWALLGEREVPGDASNPRLLSLYREVGHTVVKGDETAWCAAFAGACLERAGLASTRSLMARSYLTWGEALDVGRSGAIAVLERGGDPRLGHVGFLIGETDDRVFLLGGNQSDAVSVGPFARTRLLALRWPRSQAGEGTNSPASDDAILFDWALAHVLEMEGGNSDDPYDPGGPTNFGITLRVYAAWTGRSLNALNYAALKGELRHISPETVRDIYRTRYWQTSGAAELPAPLALMHFDASVNHGVGTAIRFLQRAVGAEADGEIGPETRARVAEADVSSALARYADIRRRRYRELKHFWRFGRGWLKRVDRALERARQGAPKGSNGSTSSSTEKGEHPMSSENSVPVTGKWWGESMTVWGALITAIATVLPTLGPAIGLDITPELVREAGGQMIALVQALAGLAGTIMTIYGRTRANAPLQRRMLTVRV